MYAKASAPRYGIHSIADLFRDRLYPQRQKNLANDDIHQCFIEFGQQGPSRGAWIGEYVIMPDHLHAFVALDEGQVSLAKWGKSLKNALSKVLRQHRVIAPHWQKSFFDHVIRSGESCVAKWEYVRANPVRAGLTKNPEDWPFMGQIFPLEFNCD
jgi:REP-associated tyrosine transposase